MSVRAVALTVACLAAVFSSRPIEAYSHIGVDVAGQTKAIRWNVSRPRWFARERAVPGVSASEFQQELARAFATWEDVPTSSIAFDFGGFTAAAPFEDDGLSVVGFEAEPDMERVLGATTFVIDAITGEIVESDIFFNSIFPWSVAAGGEAGRYDLRSVAVHEIGHFIGLGHSAIGETELRSDGTRRVLATGAVMFPISLGRGVVADRTLQPDDVAGAADLYPDGHVEDDSGIIVGSVRLAGAPVFGAHVVAFNLRTGSLVGGLSGEGGRFRIARLTPGPYALRVEPLDDADVDSFLDATGVNVDFRVAFHPRLVAAPRGGASPATDITVQSK